jgi:hypothetical protein
MGLKIRCQKSEIFEKMHRVWFQWMSMN